MRVLSLTLAASLWSLVVHANPLARGWGDSIAWVSLQDGLDAARTSDQPLCLVIWKTWCGACKNLRPVFAASAEINELAGRFVMVNVVDDEEPKDAAYAPDGGYIPRILFLDSNGSVMTDVHTGNAQYKYFYSSADSIAENMRRVAASSAAKLVDAAPPAAELHDL